MINSTAQARAWLERLCLPDVSRSTGSPGNLVASAWCAEFLQQLGWQVRTPEFGCIDWQTQGANLSVDGFEYQVFPNPYTLGCDVAAALVSVSTLEALHAVQAKGMLLVLSGELTREQLMPRHFPFYNPDEHQAIYRALDTAMPAAVIAATERNPDQVGAQYPFPLIEDGDCDIPGVFMTAEEGQRLLAHHGQKAYLKIRAERIPARGCNVIATRGNTTGQRIVLTAHLDAHIGSPGATDDASGVVALLLLAELLATWDRAPGIEIALLNGEDYYAASGEKLWLAENEDRFGDILLGINLDDVAYIMGRTAYSLYNCSNTLAAAIREQLGGQNELMEGEQWYQGDHVIMVQQGCPALAFTSEKMSELMARITHSSNDTPDQVNANKLASLATSLRGLVLCLAGRT